MFERLLVFAIVVGAAYWYWTGPYQARVNPSYGQKLQQNAQAMEDCRERRNYAAGRTLTQAGDLEEICAKELNLYFENGQWHSYEDSRPD